MGLAISIVAKGKEKVFHSCIHSSKRIRDRRGRVGHTRTCVTYFSSFYRLLLLLLLLQVWYHQCPSKGATCNDTRFVEEGGCSIWYDEPSYLQAIKARLDQDIDLLAPDFTYAGGLVSYGQKRVKEGEESDVLLHLQQLSPLVKELAGLESSAQKQFWRLKSSFFFKSWRSWRRRRRKAKGLHRWSSCWQLRWLPFLCFFTKESRVW